ncbi:MAG: type II secretion system F family protein [archaeon]
MKKSKRIRIPWKKIPFLEKEGKLIILSYLGGIIFLLDFIFFYESSIFMNLAIFSIILIIFPIFLSRYIKYSQEKEMELYFSDFLRDVSESIRAGVPLPRAIENASKGAYGVLAQRMKYVSAQISWGLPFEVAIQKFADGVESKLLKQACAIIIESFKSGGEIADIFETISVDIREIKRIQSERKSKLQIFTISMYAIFFLFLFIMLILIKTFIPSTPELNKAAVAFGGTSSKMTEEDYKTIFLHLCLIQAFFAGIIAGMMGEGSPIAGFKHSIAMILISLICFQLFLQPEAFQNRVAETITKIPFSLAGIKSEATAFTIYTSLTSGDVASIAREIAKSKKITGYESLTGANIVFEAQPTCTPCVKGDLIVTEYAIYVKKPSRITYTVISTGQGYKILIGGAT